MSKERIKFLICLLLIIIFVAIFGYQLGAWTGFPKGIDAYARITRIVYILDFFPNINWLYQWSNGMPNFKTEGPLFYFLGAILTRVFSLPVEKSLIVIGFFTFVFIAIGLFGYVFSSTENFLAGLLAAILGLSSYAVWDWMVYGGVYPRILGVGFSLLALWQFTGLVKMTKRDKPLPKWLFLGTVLSLAAAMITHVLMAFYAWINTFLILVFMPLPARLKVKVGFWVYLTAFCLTGFFFLPLVLGFAGGASHLLGADFVQAPIPLFYLFNFDGIGPFILPLLVLSSIFIFVFLKSTPRRLFLPPLLMFAYFITYGLVGYTGLPGKYYTILGFIPLSASLFIAIYGSILIGLIFSRAEKFSKWVTRAGFSLLALFIFLSLTIGVDYIKGDHHRVDIWDTSVLGKGNWIYTLQRILKFPKEDLNHRFSASIDSEAIWFNTFYKTPQVRDYYAQGVLYPDWRFWHEQTVWNKEKFSLDEAGMSLDWFAVRWFSDSEYDKNLFEYDKTGGRVGISPEEFLSQSQNRYLHQPGFRLTTYGFFREGGLHEQFEIENPSPILSASNAPAALFIGDKAGYEIFFRNLSLINLNSQKIIPVLGKRFIDDYKLSDLTYFKTIVLYNYRYHQREKAYKLLKDYLNQGGNLIWETAGSPDEGGVLPEPAPVGQLVQKEIKEDWSFKPFGEDITAGINFSSFSPLVYNGGYWKVSSVSSDDLRPWASGILGKNGDWVAVAGSYGQGKVIWTGFNFPYHINANKNQEEARLLAKMISWFEEEEAKAVNYKTEFVNPEKRVVEVKEPTKGVLFKESYYPSWHAFLIDSSGEKRNLKIMLAGPAMMYTLLPKEVSLPAKVVFEYKYSFIEKLGFGLSLLTLLGLISYLFLGRLPIPESFSKNILGWWDREEE